MTKPIETSQLEDADLVEVVRSEDQEAYVYVVERYQAKLIRYATTIMHDDEKAADVVQEAFIKAFVNLHSYDKKLKFSSWIYRITHNEAINYIRKHKREVKPEDEEWFDKLPSEGKVVSDEVDEQLLRKHMNQALGTLPEKYRDPLLLYFFEHQSYNEISDILKLPKPTVGTRIKRGKEQLKKYLEKNGIQYEW